MNNPHNLTQTERAITPTHNFNKGINCDMSKARRKAKQARHKANEDQRRAQSAK